MTKSVFKLTIWVLFAALILIEQRTYHEAIMNRSTGFSLPPSNDSPPSLLLHEPNSPTMEVAQMLNRTIQMEQRAHDAAMKKGDVLTTT